MEEIEQIKFTAIEALNKVKKQNQRVGSGWAASVCFKRPDVHGAPEREGSASDNSLRQV